MHRKTSVQKGQTLVEYALILALICLIVVTTLGLFGNQIVNTFNFMANKLGNVIQ